MTLTKRKMTAAPRRKKRIVLGKGKIETGYFTQIRFKKGVVIDFIKESMWRKLYNEDGRKARLILEIEIPKRRKV